MPTEQNDLEMTNKRAAYVCWWAYWTVFLFLPYFISKTYLEMPYALMIELENRLVMEHQ